MHALAVDESYSSRLALSSPSGASAIAVGFVSPLATTESVNPAGTVAAGAIEAVKVAIDNTRHSLKITDFIESSKALKLQLDKPLGRD